MPNEENAVGINSVGVASADAVDRNRQVQSPGGLCKYPLLNIGWYRCKFVEQEYRI